MSKAKKLLNDEDKAVVAEAEPEVETEEETEAEESAPDYSGGIGKPYYVRLEIEGISNLSFGKGTELPEEAANMPKDEAEHKYWRLHLHQKGKDYLVPLMMIQRCMVAGAKYLNRKVKGEGQRKIATYISKAAWVNEDAVLKGLKESDWEEEEIFGSPRREMGKVWRSFPTTGPGWRAEFRVRVSDPKRIQPQDIVDSLTTAGEFDGLGRFRPSAPNTPGPYGRFKITKWAREDA